VVKRRVIKNREKKNMINQIAQEIACFSNQVLCDKIRETPCARAAIGEFKAVSAAAALVKAALPADQIVPSGGFLLRDLDPLIKRVEDVMGEIVHLPPALGLGVSVAEAAAVSEEVHRAMAGSVYSGNPPDPTILARYDSVWSG
jgi:hypothetical protein